MAYEAINRNDFQKLKKELESYIPETGYNILHDAISKNKTQMALYILDMFPGLTMIGDQPYNNTPLMYAICSRNHELITAIASKCADSFRVCNDMGDYPLHTSVKTKNLSIVRLVYDQDRDVIHMKNVDGWYPLHISASYGNTQITKFLYERFPDQVRELDLYNQTPLHLCGKFLNNDIFINKAVVEPGIIRFLSDIYPEAARIPNSIGDLPIHMISMKCVSMSNSVREDIKHMVDLYPESLFIANHNGMLPIHVASFYHDLRLVKMFYIMAPDTLYLKNKNDKSALNYFDNACMRDKRELYSFVLSNSTPDDVFWESIPRTIPDIESYFGNIYNYSRENAFRLLQHCQKKVRSRLMYVYNTLQLVSTNYRGMEQELLLKITFMSM